MTSICRRSGSGCSSCKARATRSAQPRTSARFCRRSSTPSSTRSLAATTRSRFQDGTTIPSKESWTPSRRGFCKVARRPLLLPSLRRVALLRLLDRVRHRQRLLLLCHRDERGVVAVQRLAAPPRSCPRQSISRLLAPAIAATSSFSLSCTASESLFCVRWMRNTIRNVTMVVPVLMTSCQVFGEVEQRTSQRPDQDDQRTREQTRSCCRSSASRRPKPLAQVR